MKHLVNLNNNKIIAKAKTEKELEPILDRIKQDNIAIKDEKVKVENDCICCGGTAKATYTRGDEHGKCFAEVVDVCGDCCKSGCKTLSGEICKVTEEKQVQLKNM